MCMKIVFSSPFCNRFGESLYLMLSSGIIRHLRQQDQQALQALLLNHHIHQKTWEEISNALIVQINQRFLPSKN